MMTHLHSAQSTGQLKTKQNDRTAQPGLAWRLGGKLHLLCQKIFLMGSRIEGDSGMMSACLVSQPYRP